MVGDRIIPRWHLARVVGSSLDDTIAVLLLLLLARLLLLLRGFASCLPTTISNPKLRECWALDWDIVRSIGLSIANSGVLFPQTLEVSLILPTKPRLGPAETWEIVRRTGALEVGNA